MRLRPRRSLLRVGGCVIILGAVLVAVAACDQVADTTAQPRSVVEAVRQGDLGAATALLEAGADPDERALSLTALMRAAVRDDLAMSELLLRFGADVDATTPEGLTVWHVAAAGDSEEVLEFLIAEGVDLERRSANGMNTLNHAAAAGAVGSLHLLAGAGAELDAPSGIVTQGHGYPIDEGSTSLAIAARSGHADAVAALLELGASVDARSSTGQTALAQAVVTGQPADVVELLLGAGADPTIVVECAERCGSASQDIVGWGRVTGDAEVVALLEAAVAGSDWLSRRDPAEWSGLRSQKPARGVTRRDGGYTTPSERVPRTDREREVVTTGWD